MIERDELSRDVAAGTGAYLSRGQDRSGPARIEPDRHEPDGNEPDRDEPDRDEPDRDEPDRTGLDETDRVLPTMRGLRSRARVTNLARAGHLDIALERAANAALDEAGRAQAVAVAHQLIGSAGTFGFTEASRRAAELKDFFACAHVDDEDVQTARIRLTALRGDLQVDDPDVEF